VPHVAFEHDRAGTFGDYAAIRGEQIRDHRVVDQVVRRLG
jgi:hypothetical protein